jgi:SAM-dependent methyltransferase
LSDPFAGFARFYDVDYRHHTDDLDFIAMLAADFGDPVLELGSGTGRVLLPLALASHRVTGVDASPALHAVARQKLAAANLARQVTLIEGDLRTFDLTPKNFAFAVCASNTLMHFTSVEDQLAVLHNAWKHLAPGGHLLVDLFNPDVPRLLAINGMQELADQWQDDESGAQVLKWSVRTVDLAEQLQETVFIYEEVFADGNNRRTVLPFTLRFLWRSEAELMLRLAGFAVAEVWGDFFGAPYDAMSEQIVLLARKP